MSGPGLGISYFLSANAFGLYQTRLLMFAPKGGA